MTTDFAQQKSEIQVPIRALTDKKPRVVQFGISNVSIPVKWRMGKSGRRTTILVSPTNPRNNEKLKCSSLSFGIHLFRNVEYTP